MFWLRVFTPASTYLLLNIRTLGQSRSQTPFHSCLSHCAMRIWGVEPGRTRLHLATAHTQRYRTRLHLATEHWLPNNQSTNFPSLIPRPGPQLLSLAVHGAKKNCEEEPGNEAKTSPHLLHSGKSYCCSLATPRED